MRTRTYMYLDNGMTIHRVEDVYLSYEEANEVAEHAMFWSKNAAEVVDSK